MGNAKTKYLVKMLMFTVTNNSNDTRVIKSQPCA